MKRISTLLTLIFLANLAGAQFTEVLYNYDKNRFGENQPLPAEQNWILSGEIPQGIDMVELKIYDDADMDDEALYSSDYREPLGRESERFSIPVSYRLRGGSEYTFTIGYYERADSAEIARLSNMVNEALEAYLNLSVESDRNSVNLTKDPRLMMQDLNQIVSDGLSLYRNQLGREFRGFSQLVYEKLNYLEGLRLRKARFNIISKEDQDKQDERIAFFMQNMNDLEGLLKREVEQYLSQGLYSLVLLRTIESYETEKTRWELPINFGYAAVYNDGPIDDISWDGAPLVGLSIPLANPKLSGKFWAHSSLSAGILLDDLEFGERTMTGPVVDKPIYLAYGFKTAYFVRINAGTTLLVEEGADNDDIEFGPFIGLSVEINLWLGLSR